MARRLWPSNPWLRRGAIGAIALVMVLSGLLLLARHEVKTLITRRASARGWGITLDKPHVLLPAGLSIPKACVSFENDDHADVCVQNLQIRFRPWSLLGKTVRIRRLSADAIHIETSRNRLTQLRSHRKTNEPSKDSDGESYMRRLGHATIDTMTIALRDAKRAIDLHVSDVQIRGRHGGVSLDAHAQLLAFEGDSPAIEEALQGFVHQSFSTHLKWKQTGELNAADVHFDTRAHTTIPLSSPLSLAFDGITFSAPYTVRVTQPSIALEAQDTSIRAQFIESHVGMWTTRLPAFYLASLSVDSPVVTVSAPQRRHLMRQLKTALIGPKTHAQHPPQAAPTSHSNAPPATTGAPTGSARAPTPQNIVRRFRSTRHWWEVLPRAIHITNADIHLLGDEDGQELSIADAHIDYGVQVLDRQMDVEFGATLRHAKTEAGTVKGRMEWDYSKEIARVFWHLHDVDLSTLSFFLSKADDATLSGTMRSDGHLRVDAHHKTTGTQATSIDDLRIDHPLLESPLEVRHVGIEGEIGPTDADKKLPSEHAPYLILAHQKITWNDSHAELSLRFDDVDLWHAPRISNAHIRLNVPDQPAMQLFGSIPASILGPLQGTEMTGTWGLTLAFRIENTGMTDDGRAVWKIHAPSTYTLRDNNLTLVSLPHDVDVRRLRKAMHFVFRGPDDSFMRPLDIPAPHPFAADPPDISPGTSGHVHPQTTPTQTPPSTGHRWVPLRNMSYYFIATQLYREDGSFFRNSGINWYQIRSVLARALTTGHIARGASTITMQTVKNIFLSQNKSVERKLRELFLTYWLTRAVPKARTLEVYLNIIELGPNCNGANEASEFYFDTPITDLGIRKSVWLSAISPNPTRLGGTKPKGTVPPGSCRRCDRLLGALHKRGWINDAEFRKSTAGAAASDLLGDSTPETDDAHDVEAAHDSAHDSPSEQPTIQSIGLAGGLAPPLLKMLHEKQPAAPRVDTLPIDQRLKRWIEDSRPVRGVR